MPSHYKVHGLPQGAGSKGFVKGRKKPGQTQYGLTGINVFNAAFKSPMAPRINFHNMTKKQLDGRYVDYDGPCAAWNDMAVHHHTFTVYSLDVVKLGLPSNGQFQNSGVIAAMKGHVLAKATLVGNYVTNQQLLNT